MRISLKGILKGLSALWRLNFSNLNFNDMKPILFLLSLIFVVSCGQHSNSNDVKNSVPGEYIFNGGTELSQGSDTIIISAFDEKAATYMVIRNTGFRRLIDGRLQPKEFKSEKFIATYDDKKQQLADSKTGRLLSFSSSNKDLVFGTATYQKIK